MRKRRDDLVHEYESFLISIDKGESDTNILGYFSIKSGASITYRSIRECFGFILCKYQKLTDNILDHFDTKFREWYGIVPGRTLTIMQGCVAFPLWWAYKYGNYRHKDLQVSEGSVY